MIRHLHKLAILCVAGCSLADPALYEALGNDAAAADAPSTETGADTTGVEQDAVDECGAGGGTVIDSTRIGLTINTEVLTPRVDVTSSCGIASRGSDGFIGIDVQAGQVWHFHLKVLGRVDRNPSIYLLRAAAGGGCNTRSCEQVADTCTGPGEEHFAFVPNAPGRWYIGVDDGEIGGAQYELDAYLTLCNTEETEHGESCDGNLGVRDANCSPQCRIILNDANTRETFPNQNFVEANELDLGDDRILVIGGNVGDSTGQCAYPDVFTTLLPVRARFLVRPEACTAAADARYDLTLLTPSGNVLSSGMRNVDGCPFIDEDLEPGRYFVRVDMRPFGDTFVTNYQLHFEATPL